MPINDEILGLNARNFLYIRKYNKRSAKALADNKLSTKKRLISHDLPTPDLIKVFPDRTSVRLFSWDLPEEGFVVKPERGYGGEGILIFKNWKDGQGESINGQIYNIQRLESHILDIFEGVYSLQSLPDEAFIEEKITTSQFFKKIAPIGLPDIRVIVFNSVPVMAMLRLPTIQSRGKANLHQGAIGVGIDLRTGITTHAVLEDHPVEFIPDTKIKVRGIKLPHWDEILEIATKAQRSSKLGFAGVDLVIDAEDQVKILELNARPGLSIQIANLSSLRSRLERVENLKITSVERGVQLAKSLFAEEFSEKLRLEPIVLSYIEPIVIKNGLEEQTVEAKIDTGAFRTSIDRDLVNSLNLVPVDQKFFVKAASGQQLRDAVHFDFFLKGKKISTTASVATRSHLKFPVIIGRRDLKGFVIDPNALETEEDESDETEETFL